MAIAIYNQKGGTGKTTFAVQLSRMLGWTYVTNDAFAGAHNLLEENTGFLVPKKEKEIPFEHGIVFDFGGFEDSRSKDVLAQVDKVVVPTLTSILDVQSTIATLKDVYKVNNKVVIVINRVKPIYGSKNKFYKPEALIEYLKEELNKAEMYFEYLEFHIVREAVILEELLFDGISVHEKVKDNNRDKYIYRNALDDMSKLKNLVMEEEENGCK